ncbi:aldo/keto reductase, partial [Aeromonas salmonicida]|uniref:aldo/keto reductase n=1 Tax=Aeromonas salmonicida TaxID=645 RepID=UPI003D31E15E
AITAKIDLSAKADQRQGRLPTLIHVWRRRRPPDTLMDADEVADAFISLKQAGKVKHLGVSNFSARQFELLQSRLPLSLIHISE